MLLDINHSIYEVSQGTRFNKEAKRYTFYPQILKAFITLDLIPLKNKTFVRRA